MARANLVVAIVAIACALLDVRTAHACSPGHHPAGVTATHPSGATHPANAAIVLGGGMLGPYALEATIDGLPAEVTRDAALSFHYSPDDADLVLALRVTPEPLPGQVVRVSGNACVSWATSVCPIDVTYTAGPRDDTAPAAPTGWWDYESYPAPSDPYFLDSCGLYPSLGVARVFVDVPVSATPPSDTTYLRIAPVPPSTSFGASPQGIRPATAASIEHGLALDVTQIGAPPDPSGFCVDIELVDAAGNGSGPFRLCPACQHDGCYPAERSCPPHLTPASPAELCTSPMADGGVAPLDGGGPGRDAGTPDAAVGAPTGGGCAVLSGDAPWPVALGFLAAAIGAARRRSRRARSA